MLPNRLISQNPGGIMLFLALSEAIHCQTNRSPKIKLPVHPMIFHAFISSVASCKIAKSDCMRSLSHRIFFAATGAHQWSAASLARSTRSEPGSAAFPRPRRGRGTRLTVGTVLRRNKISIAIGSRVTASSGGATYSKLSKIRHGCCWGLDPLYMPLLRSSPNLSMIQL